AFVADRSTADDDVTELKARLQAPGRANGDELPDPNRRQLLENHGRHWGTDAEASSNTDASISGLQDSKGAQWTGIPLDERRLEPVQRRQQPRRIGEDNCVRDP